MSSSTRMRLISSIAEMREFGRNVRARGQSLGLVPTMGALHQGHLSLVRQAMRQSDIIVVSVFVNPTQFNSDDDLRRYPRNLEKDLDLLRPFNVAVTFAPKAQELYPEGASVFVDPGNLAIIHEGVFRSGHFRGVATVVLKLLNIIRPDVAYFGQKDFQQVQIIRRLIEDLNLEVRPVICPTVREPDGLAISSRNAYLNVEERQAALVLFQSLRLGERLAQSGETSVAKVLGEMQKLIIKEPKANIEYAVIVEPAQLQPVDRLQPGCIALLAAHIGPARLIDNLIFGPPGASQEMLLQLALTVGPAMDTSALIPGFEAEAVRLSIAKCRNCAAISTIQLPPREFLAAYVKTHYPDLGAPQVAIIARNSPGNAHQYLYHIPPAPNRFAANLFELLGVQSFAEFKARFVLTDAVRCHSTAPHVADSALAHCAQHLLAELRLFPNLKSLVVLGEDAYLQFHRYVLGRSAQDIKPFDDLMKVEGWAQEESRVPALGDRPMRIIYGYHPTLGYKRSPSIARWLA